MERRKMKRRGNEEKIKGSAASKAVPNQVARRPIRYLGAFPGFQSISVNGMLLGRSDRRDGGDELV